jgi:hypothetical protein
MRNDFYLIFFRKNAENEKIYSKNIKNPWINGDQSSIEKKNPWIDGNKPSIEKKNPWIDGNKPWIE